MSDSRQALEQLAQNWEQQAADIHGGASVDDMSDFGRARWAALRECAQALRAACDDLAESVVVEPTGAASPAELRTALAHYGRHTEGCAVGKHASARHGGCTCGLSSAVDGGPVTAHVRGLVGAGGLGTEIPVAAWHDPEQMLLARLDYLTRVNTAYLLGAKQLAQGAAPALYASGVALRSDAGGEEVLDIRAALQRGAADIDALACWRAAELRAAGVAAEAILVRVRRKTGVTYTCRVRLPDGAIEDVQQRLCEGRDGQ